MGFFGIGGSNKKKDDAAEGIVHDTKRDAPDASKDILDEFEAQFSEGGPVQAPSEPSQTPPVQQAASSTHEDFKPPSAPSRPSTPSASQAPAPPPTPPQPAPTPKAPQPQRTQAPSPGPQSPRPQTSPAYHDDSSSEDLPDFDFDFHPSQPEPQSASSRAMPPQSHAPPPGPSPQPHASPSPQRPGPQPHAPQEPQQRPPSQQPFPSRPFETPSQPPRPQEPKPPVQERSDRFDLPDFSSDAFRTGSMPEPQRMPERAPPEHPTQEPGAQKQRPKTWDDLTAPSGTRPWQSAPARPEPLDRSSQAQSRQAPEPAPKAAQPENERASRFERPSEPQEVVMRGGTLYIEKHALVRHVHDLNDLKGLSTSTDEQFKRVDALAQEEKKALDKMQSAIHALHDTLEQTDELLFKGE